MSVKEIPTKAALNLPKLAAVKTALKSADYGVADYLRDSAVEPTVAGIAAHLGPGPDTPVPEFDVGSVKSVLTVRTTHQLRKALYVQYAPYAIPTEAKLASNIFVQSYV